MKAAQIAVGVSYEDKRAETVRRVIGILSISEKKFVEYLDQGPGYWPGRKVERMSLAEFAKWVARPAGAKSPFKNWRGGELDHQFAKKT